MADDAEIFNIMKAVDSRFMAGKTIQICRFYDLTLSMTVIAFNGNMHFMEIFLIGDGDTVKMTFNARPAPVNILYRLDVNLVMPDRVFRRIVT